MQLLCHRGLWKNPEEKNSFSALALAIDKGLGIETDVRDCDGDLVIAHDPPIKDQAMNLDVLFSHYAKSKFAPCLALNIKSDGLHTQLVNKLNEYQIKNYFVFDMSVPDTLGYLKMNMPFAARISDYERDEKLLERAKFVWLDSFESDWYSIDLIQTLLAKDKSVAIVSPELHKRAHEETWSRLRALADHEKVYLCTDFVTEAMEFFHVQ